MAGGGQRIPPADDGPERRRWLKAKASYDADDLASTEFDLSASEMAALSKTTARGEVVVELEA